MMFSSIDGRIQSALNRITYKPNVRINFHRTMNSLEFRIICKTICAVHGGETEIVHFKMFDEKFFDRREAFNEKHFISVVGGWLWEMEKHEFEEFFKVDGIPVKDPHEHERMK